MHDRSSLSCVFIAVGFTHDGRFIYIHNMHMQANNWTDNNTWWQFVPLLASLQFANQIDQLKKMLCAIDFVLLHTQFFQDFSFQLICSLLPWQKKGSTSIPMANPWSGIEDGETAWLLVLEDERATMVIIWVVMTTTKTLNLWLKPPFPVYMRWQPAPAVT